METKTDYYKEILGTDLTGAKTGPGVESKIDLNIGLETTVQIVERDKFLFYANHEDFEANITFVRKILGAVQKNDGLVITNLADVKKLNPVEVFSFGEAVELLGIKVHSFPSFSEISESTDYKARLWTELKKRI